MAAYNDIPIIGGFLDNPEQEALQKQFEEMSRQYQLQRIRNAEVRPEILRSQLSMLGPVQQYLSGMLPGIQPFDTQGVMSQFEKRAATMAGDVRDQASPSQLTQSFLGSFMGKEWNPRTLEWEQKAPRSLDGKAGGGIQFNGRATGKSEPGGLFTDKKGIRVTPRR